MVLRGNAAGQINTSLQAYVSQAEQTIQHLMQALSTYVHTDPHPIRSKELSTMALKSARAKEGLSSARARPPKSASKPYPHPPPHSLPNPPSQTPLSQSLPGPFRQPPEWQCLALSSLECQKSAEPMSSHTAIGPAESPEGSKVRRSMTCWPMAVR